MPPINGKRLAEKRKDKECTAKQPVNDECTWWLGRFYVCVYIFILYLYVPPGLKDSICRPDIF
jgi:hypothetical protein